MKASGHGLGASDFRQVVEIAYAPFLEPLGFSMQAPETGGRFYLVYFTSKTHRLTLTFEPGENWARLYITDSIDPNLADIDDPVRSPQISDLNRLYSPQISAEDRRRVDSSFPALQPRSQEEAQLLTWARELRLVLPLYLRAHRERQ